MVLHTPDMSAADWIARIIWGLSALAAWGALLLAGYNTYQASRKDRVKLRAVARIQGRRFTPEDKRDISMEDIEIAIQNRGRIVEVCGVTLFPWEMAEVGNEFINRYEDEKLEPNHSLRVTIRSGVIRHLEHPLLFRRLTVRLAEGRCVYLKVKNFRKCCKEVTELSEDEIFDVRPMLTEGGLYLRQCRRRNTIPGWWTRWRDRIPSAD